MSKLNWNDIEEFEEAMRGQMPELISRMGDGDVQQVSDEGLMAWTANAEAAFRIKLSNGAEFDITLRRTVRAEEECITCHKNFWIDEIEEDGQCINCFMDSEERKGAVPIL